jgi:hypothetical protein
MIVGTGQFKYRACADWAKLPDGWSSRRLAALRKLSTLKSSLSLG